MKLFFFDVDTQNDFMNADGALYVPDAESLKPILKRLTEFAVANDILIHSSVDSHSEEDAEFIPNGGPFPLHCMSGAPGQEKIQETLTGKENYIPSGRGQGLIALEWSLLQGGMGTRDHLVFEKQTYDVMTNHTLKLYKKHCETVGHDLSDTVAIVYGVATDYCVRAAALGLRSMGLQVKVVEDAIRGITPEGVAETFAEFEKQGIELVSSDWVFDNCQKMAV